MELSTFVTAAIGTALTWVFVYLLMMANSRRKDLWAADVHGVIRPNPTQYMVFSLIGFGFAAGFGYGIYHSYMTFLYERIYLYGPGAALFAVLGWASLCFAWDRAVQVSWEANGLTGPVNHWFFPFGPRRKHIAYRDILGLGVDRWDAFIVWDDTGDAIRWSYLYKGFAALNAQIEARRPDLIDAWSDDDDPFE